MMTPSQMYMIDSMAKQFKQDCCQSHRKNFPMPDFSRGVSNLTLMTASEQTGLLFLLVVLFHSDKGRQLLTNVTESCVEPVTADGMLNAMEKLLCFYFWTQQPTFSSLDMIRQEYRAIKRKIAGMLRLLKTEIPRTSGCLWKLSKFHEMLHLPWDMCRYGSPINYQANIPEHNHIYFAKKPGRRCRKTHHSFDKQVAERVAQRRILQTVHAKMQDSLSRSGSMQERAVMDDRSQSVIEESLQNASKITQLQV